MSDVRPAARSSRSPWKWLAAATLASALAMAPLGCDPPPTAIPPGPTQIVSGPLVEKPIPPPTVSPPADFEVGDAGPGSGAAEAGSEAGSGAAGAGSSRPGSGPGSAPASDKDSNLVRDGGPCERAIECASGICEGQGCGPDRKGVCMARNRSCTRDLRAYCGCDGKPFQGSGSCPGRRFSARGACK